MESLTLPLGGSMLHSCQLLSPEVPRETFLLVPLGILSGDLFLDELPCTWPGLGTQGVRIKDAGLF